MTNCGCLESIHCSHIPSDILYLIFFMSMRLTVQGK